MKTLITIAFCLLSCNVFSQDGKSIEKLAFGESDEKVEAIAALVASGTPKAAEILQALADGELSTSGKRVLIVKGDSAVDAVSGEKLAQVPEDKEDVIANNRVRRELGGAIAALRLVSPRVEVRSAAAKELMGSAELAMLPLVHKALASEQNPGVKALLEQIAASLELKAEDRATRLAAVQKLGSASNPNMKTLLIGFLGDEKDEDLRSEARKSLQAIEGRLAWGERLGVVFTSVSLGSILLLAALGLAITYGLMGVINMAHGELIMIGAYSTYVMQNLFRKTAFFDWYLLAAIPFAFLVSGIVGMLLERTVIRWLYGRPLETLLSTWGISLILIQAVRTVFGAANVQVENPAFMSGGIEAITGVVLPWSRVVIIAFAVFVLVLVYLLLNKTRLGLFVRGVTQNREMAACVGVSTARVDTWAFGLGSGIAGLAGCALSQIDNVGPNLGQSYIVDSFMVVVLGGVGQLAGTVYAALGLGFANKLLEAWQGAVLAKIAVLVFIIVFIQKRPQGMFALKGRAVESMSRLYGPRGWTVLGVFALFAFVVLPVSNLYVPQGSAFHVSNFWVTLAGKIMCYAIVAVAMDLVWGYAGILSLGHGLFFALGGYAFGMYLMRQIGSDGQYRQPMPDFMVFLDWKEFPWQWWNSDSFWWCAMLVVVVPGLLAYVFGYFAFRSRVKGVYFSIITQALTFAAMLLFFRNATGFGGNNGFTDFRRILDIPIATPQARMTLCAITAATLIGTLLLGRWLMTSKFGRVLAAIRDAETRVMFCGYDTLHYKLFVWTLSAVLCGIAGALYVPQVGIINPSEMSPANSIEIAIWVAVGGRGTLAGAALGAGLVNGAKSFFTQVFPEYWLFFLGAIFILVTLFMPQGVWGLIDKFKKSHG